MSENDDKGHNLEEAAAEGPLPGLDEAELAEREGRDPSGTPDSSENDDSSGTHDSATDGQTDDDAPAGGVVMGAINQH